MNYLVYLPGVKNGFAITCIQGQGSESVDLKKNDISVAEDGTRIVAVVTLSSVLAGEKEAIQLNFFKCKNVFNFYMNFDYASFGPFILVCQEDDALFELSWNGKIPNLKNILMSNRYLWSMDEEVDEKATKLEEIIFNEDQFNNSGYFPNLLQMLREKLFMGKRSIKNFDQRVYSCSIIKNGKSLKLMYDDGKNNSVKEFSI